MSATELRIRAQADPHTLSRLANYLAQLGAVPRRLCASVNADGMDVVIEPEGVSERQIDSIAEKMRASVLVEYVRIERGEPYRSSAGERP